MPDISTADDNFASPQGHSDDVDRWSGSPRADSRVGGSCRSTSRRPTAITASGLVGLGWVAFKDVAVVIVDVPRYGLDTWQPTLGFRPERDEKGVRLTPVPFIWVVIGSLIGVVRNRL